MHVEIEQMPEFRVATVRHVGPYDRIAEAFERLGTLAGRAGLAKPPDVKMVAIFYDDPATTKPEDLRADAGLVVPPAAALPGELGEERIPAGRYARVEHIGPYDELGEAWGRFKKALPAAGQRPGRGPSFEIYRNTPETARPEELVTHLYMSVA